MIAKELLERYQAGPSLLRKALAGLTAADLSYKYDPKKWSAREIAIHVADMDLVGSFRMKRVIAEEYPKYPGVDQDLWASHLHYQEREVEPALLLLELVRKEMASLLNSLSEADWQRKGLHDEAGEQTLLRLVENYTGHLENHAGQIQAIRQRLGK